MIYVVTNRKLAKHGNLIWVVKEALKGGADAIILREKDLSDEELLPLAMEIKELTNQAEKLLIINGSIQVAKESESDGYHSSFGDFMENKPNLKLDLGVSVHSVEEAILAEKQGADYLLAGHVFPTDCKKGLAPRGIEFIENIKRSINIPLIAIGGINTYNGCSVMESGAMGIAIMSSVMEAENPAEFIEQMKKKINK